MELPFLGPRKNRRSRPPQDMELGAAVRHRFTRALGVFDLLKRKLGDGRSSVSTDLTVAYRSDCLREITDAMASDAYRAFFEREFGCLFRLERNDGMTLHAASHEGLAKLESEIRKRFDRKSMDHRHSFGIATVRFGVNRFARKKDVISTYEPPVHDDAIELTELRALMACFPYRDDLQRQLEVSIGFLLPARLTYTARSRSIAADLSEQLRLEGLL